MIELSEVGIDHLIPLGETGTRWRQTREIPVKHRTEKSDSSLIENLFYQYRCARFGVRTSGHTLLEAEEKMRRHLPFDIEFDIEADMGIIEEGTVASFRTAMAEELLHYFQKET